MSATKLCAHPHTGGVGVMPCRTRYVPASAAGADPRQVLHDTWCVQPNTGAEPGVAGQVWQQAFSFRPDQARPRTYLVFETPDQGARVWLNGTCLGDGAAEFDISALVREGANSLSVLLPEGRTVEGDVYLLKRPENHIWDYAVSTEIGARATVEVRVCFAGTVQTVSARLLDGDGAIAAEQTATDGVITLHVREPRLWDLEARHVYTLVLESAGEQIRASLALRKVCVDGGKLLLNGQSLKIVGTAENTLTLLRA